MMADVSCSDVDVLYRMLIDVSALAQYLSRFLTRAAHTMRGGSTCRREQSVGDSKFC
jgi:hypothetical protein